MAKQYGLIVPEKKGAKKQEIGLKAKNVFGDDSDSDTEECVQKISFNPGDKLKRQARIAQEKVIQEDPTVYQYDELYDSMEKSKKEKITQAKVEKKPRYIEKLLVAADKRKKENERRVERQVQKEREEEGDKFADKESFVTTAYRNKLEEMRLDEEKERRREYLEELCDVKKQNDLGSFYRHLYNQQVNTKEEETTNKDKEDINKDDKDSSKDKEESSTDKEIANSECTDKSIDSDKKDKVKRSYRKRKLTDEPNRNSDSDDDTMGIKDIKIMKSQSSHLTSNLDADSDFSIDDSSSDDEDGKKAEKEVKIKQEVDEKLPNDGVSEPFDDFKKPDPPINKTDGNEDAEEKEKAVEEVKPKIDIWKKRTVGEVFQNALQRYYERKSKRDL